MFCYGDKTFCGYWRDCKKEDCDRAITERVRQDADVFGLPICQYGEKPDCYEECDG